ncbi:DUF6276 family protein [Halalkalicoccus tibetensis]|uniref:DUF6276 family protein n=1 Tax=Halalkalicoccus tibetensis TaxID=175632 RepID=A0ABD5V8Y2_9EURY
MSCPTCGGEPLFVPAPELGAYLPGEPRVVAVCRTCLTVTPTEADATDDPESVAELSNALPDDPDAALAMALVVTLCESLALYRAELEELVTRVERAGTDPLLALDYLADDPDLAIALDVERRRPQLVQLLE